MPTDSWEGPIPKPLSVGVTRARPQASELAKALETRGMQVVLMPAIQVLPGDLESLDRALCRLPEFDWVLFTSVNGVKATVERLPNPSALLARKVAAVGPATATEFARLGRPPDLVPPDYVAEGFFSAMHSVRGERFLWPHGDLARPDLAEWLRGRGAEVTEVEAYRTVADIWDAVPEAMPDVITFTSSSGVLATHERLAEHGRLEWLRSARLVCIGPITADTVRGLGYPVAATASEHTIAGLVRAVEELA